jgi:archaellum component FlaC
MKSERILESAEEITELPQMEHNEVLGSYVYPEEYVGKIVYCKKDSTYYSFTDAKTVSAIDKGTLSIVGPVVENMVESILEDLDDIGDIKQQLSDTREQLSTANEMIDQLDQNIEDIQSSVIEDVDSKLEKLDNKMKLFNDQNQKLINDSIEKISDSISDIVVEQISQLEADMLTKLKAMKAVDSTQSDSSNSGLKDVIKIAMMKELGFKNKDIVDMIKLN